MVQRVLLKLIRKKRVILRLGQGLTVRSNRFYKKQLIFMRRVVIIIGVFILILLGYYFCYLRNARDNRLMKEGNTLIELIDAYKNKNRKLPDSLTDIGVKTNNSGGYGDDKSSGIFYSKVDNVHYFLSYGTSLGESNYYYSDSQKWEYFYRPMK
jgi:hypothetical protein